MIVDPPRGGSIMAFAAHPDDIESWCGGTLALAIDHGATVRLLLVTSGGKGSSDPTATSERVARIREAETQEAATSSASKPGSSSNTGCARTSCRCCNKWELFLPEQAL